jgi:protein SPIRAL1 and related proteins
MSRAGSSGGGRSSLSYLFEPEEITPYDTTKSNQGTGETSVNRSSSGKDDKMTSGEADQVPPAVTPAPAKKEASNPIVSSHRPPCNIYHTSQLSHNSGLLITVSACFGTVDLYATCKFEINLEQHVEMHPRSIGPAVYEGTLCTRRSLLTRVSVQ